MDAGEGGAVVLMAVTVDIADFDRLRERIAKGIGDADLDELLDRLGAELAWETRKRLTSEKRSAEGVAWAPRRDPSETHPLLQRTNRLSSSIEHRVVPEGVEVGSNLIYAAAQMFGSPEQGILARPFLGIDEDDAKALETVAVEFLAEAL